MVLSSEFSFSGQVGDGHLDYGFLGWLYSLWVGLLGQRRSEAKLRYRPE